MTHVRGGGSASSLGSSIAALWLASLSLIGFLAGCGGGGNGSFNVGSAASTRTTTTTPTPGGQNVIPTPTPTPSPSPGAPVPSALAFQQQPTKISADKSEALTPITPPPTVAVLDNNGNVVTTATNLIPSVSAATPTARC